FVAGLQRCETGSHFRAHSSLLRMFSQLIIASDGETARPVGVERQTASDLDAVLLGKLLNAALGVDILSLTGVERMALRADLHPDVLAGRPGHERFAAGAGHHGLFVIGMNARSEEHTSELQSPC